MLIDMNPSADLRIEIDTKMQFLILANSADGCKSSDSPPFKVSPAMKTTTGREGLEFS